MYAIRSYYGNDNVNANLKACLRTDLEAFPTRDFIKHLPDRLSDPCPLDLDLRISYPGTTATYAEERGVRCMVVEIGGGYHDQPTHVANGVRGQALTAGDELRVEVVFSVLAER